MLTFHLWSACNGTFLFRLLPENALANDLIDGPLKESAGVELLPRSGRLDRGREEGGYPAPWLYAITTQRSAQPRTASNQKAAKHFDDVTWSS